MVSHQRLQTFSESAIFIPKLRLVSSDCQHADLLFARHQQLHGVCLHTCGRFWGGFLMRIFFQKKIVCLQTVALSAEKKNLPDTCANRTLLSSTQTVALSLVLLLSRRSLKQIVDFLPFRFYDTPQDLCLLPQELFQKDKRNEACRGSKTEQL